MYRVARQVVLCSRPWFHSKNLTLGEGVKLAAGTCGYQVCGESSLRWVHERKQMRRRYTRPGASAGAPTWCSCCTAAAPGHDLPCPWRRAFRRRTSPTPSIRAPQPVGAVLRGLTSAYIARNAIGYQWYPLNQQLESDQRHRAEPATTCWSGCEQTAEPYASVTLGFSRGAWASQPRWCVHAPGEFAAVVGLSGYAVDSNSPIRG